MAVLRVSFSTSAHENLMSLILGINAYHPDASACILQDGRLVAAVAEERLGNRFKHIAGFPAQAIRRVLQMAGASVKDVDHIAIGHNSKANTGAKIRRVLTSPRRSFDAVSTFLKRRGRFESLGDLVAKACDVGRADCHFEQIDVEHHMAHLASSFFSSSFDSAAGLSYDGSGDFVSTMLARCEGDTITPLKRFFVPNSLGYLYTAICQFIGFDHFGEEYKVMGLAAYGEPKYVEELKQLVVSNGKGSYELDERYIRTAGRGFEECINEKGEIVLSRLYTPELIAKLGEPRKRGDELTQRDKDMAASCQKYFEEIVLELLGSLHSQMPTDKLVTAGGCALNGVCNSRILRETPFQKSYIQCAASDDGTAIGAALYAWNSVLKKPRSPVIDHASWGPSYSDAEMESALKAAGLAYERFDGDALYKRVATHLKSGHVTGWYQGRSEWGPRALGNRSILAHPGWPGMKDLINAKIKRRESFRPFAPSILAEEVRNYFEQDVESPFMMHVVKIKPEKRDELAAVCHHDFTGRLHTVKRSQNERYYDLIREFAAQSGTPVVLNTSFNENEPIVDTPEQAIKCFQRTDMDAMCLGQFVTVKPGKSVPAGSTP